MALEIFKRNNIYSQNNLEDAYPNKKLSYLFDRKFALNEVKNVMHNRTLTPHNYNKNNNNKNLANGQKVINHTECSPQLVSLKLENLKLETKDYDINEHIVDEGFFDYCTPDNGKGYIQIWKEQNGIDDSLLDMVIRDSGNTTNNYDDDDDDDVKTENCSFEKDMFDDLEKDFSFSSVLQQNDSALENDDFDIFLEVPSFSYHHEYFLD